MSSLPAYTPIPLAPAPAYTPYPSLQPLGTSLFNHPSLLCPSASSPTSPSSSVAIDDPHLIAALREYQATQNPSNWGMRATHPRRRTRTPVPEGTRQGLWGWIRRGLELMVPDNEDLQGTGMGRRGYAYPIITW